MPTSLRDQISRLLEEPLDVILASSILGTSDIEVIAQRVESYCLGQLGSPVRACLTFTQSVGSVFLLELSDGRRVAIKVHGLGTSRMGVPATLEALEAVYAVQAALAGQGVACAQVLKPPVPFSDGCAAVAMQLLEPGPALDPHLPSVGEALATGLAEFAAKATRFRDLPNLPRSSLPEGRLFPVPHNALFNFDTPGGEWIDARAAKARAIIDATPGTEVLAHTDFSSANVRVGERGISAIFDMDSVAFIDEMRMLANTAVHFTYTGDGPWIWPSRDEARFFVQAYLRARGRPLSPDERTRLNACAIYSLSYTARCEHSFEPKGEKSTPMCERLRQAGDDELA